MAFPLESSDDANNPSTPVSGRTYEARGTL
jgi:hypothetical protein